MDRRLDHHHFVHHAGGRPGWGGLHRGWFWGAHRFAPYVRRNYYYGGPGWWAGTGLGSWVFNTDIGPGLTYSWPPQYTLYTDPSSYGYYLWPRCYYLHEGPGLAECIAEMAKAKKGG